MELTEDWTLTFVTDCRNSETITSLVKSASRNFKTVGFKLMTYHYIPHIGDIQYGSKKTVHLPKGVIKWSNENIGNISHPTNPVDDFIVKHGYPLWSEDLIKHPDFQSEKQQRHAKTVTETEAGLGLIIPVFGPRLSRGVFFLPLGRDGKCPASAVIHHLEYMCFFFHREYCRINALNGRKLELSPREIDVLKLLPLGLSNREIAATLKISPNTVNSYIKQLFLKLDTADRLTASLRAFTLGLID